MTQERESLSGDTEEAGRSRDLEFDLQQLAPRMRADRDFANEVYCALSNADWRHADGTNGRSMTWRYAAGIVATLRGCGEDYIDFYCTDACEEGTISDRVASAMVELGWSGHGHGSKSLYALDPKTGEQTIWVEGEWANVEDARREHPDLFDADTGETPADS
jgi:hypothetical protein